MTVNSIIKNIKPLLWIAILLIAIMACNQDITFPDPGFDLQSDREVDVRRDTADYYDINLLMNVPNGVAKIEVLNGRDYSLIEEITGYTNETEFEFTYEIDLREILVDTTLTYVIKVVDNDNRSFNRGFIVNVKKFSFPELSLVGGTNVALTAPSYGFKGTITTGMNTIDSIIFVFEGEELRTIVPDSAISEYELDEVFSFTGLEADKEYKFEIIVVDNIGQRGITEIFILRGFLAKPVRMKYVMERLGTEGGIDFYYDELTGRLDSFMFNINNRHYSNWNLEYNEDGNVTFLKYSYEEDGDDPYVYERNNRYYYTSGTNQLEKITVQTIRSYGSGVVEDTGEEIQAESFVYNEDGTIASYIAERQIKDIKYVDGFEEGEKICAEFWEGYGYYDILDKNRRYRTGFDPILMPTFVEGLPPFIGVNDVRTSYLNDLLFHKYVWSGTSFLYPELEGDIDLPPYSYELDAEGKMTKLVKTEHWYGVPKLLTYFFEY
ncbi:hypothetical protein SLH46_13895 [Draconibacterium sp. IB214405]|uniref:hypothetical protein n=1 Tax=Draconibacterium sp. IB214405 TaxID=3097352 RepID=UPI002A14F703|nr:hypothetical protein [Draconibacterium sp. IB214405]MDX8340288.1 hypothetical protein [Draconibacterium sp. IB214405]